MILVTGGTGIVGSRLIYDLLNKGYKVRAMKRPDSNMDFVQQLFDHYGRPSGEAEWVDGDILDVVSLENAMENVNQIFHTAALVSYRKKDAGLLLETNYRGTANVVNIALEKGIEKLCYISSIAALGKNRHGLVDENTFWTRKENSSNYSLSKFMAEREVWRGTAEGLPAVIVNPSIILGPSKSDQSSGTLMALLKKGIGYYPSGSTGYVYSGDVSRIAIELMESDIRNKRYVLNGENMSIRALLNTAADVFGNKRPSIAVQPWMLSTAAFFSAVFQGTKASITSETAASASRHASFSSEKVKGELGVNFTSIRDAIEDYRAFASKPL